MYGLFSGEILRELPGLKGEQSDSQVYLAKDFVIISR